MNLILTDDGTRRQALAMALVAALLAPMVCAASSCAQPTPFLDIKDLRGVVVHGKILDRHRDPSGTGFASSIEVVKVLRGSLTAKRITLHEVFWNYLPAEVGTEWIVVASAREHRAELFRSMCSPYLKVIKGRVVGSIEAKGEQSMPIGDFYRRMGTRLVRARGLPA